MANSSQLHDKQLLLKEVGLTYIVTRNLCSIYNYAVYVTHV